MPACTPTCAQAQRPGAGTARPACSRGRIGRVARRLGRSAGGDVRAQAAAAAAAAAVAAPGGGYDLVLSSGFLAFAKHAGFLQAVEDVGLPVRGVMGTSAGALIGSMWCAGYPPAQIAAEFQRVPPIHRLAANFRLWEGGVLSLDPVVQELQGLLPARFEDLNRDFAVGVVDTCGQHVLLHSGSLPQAVTASAAIPVVFARVAVPDVEGGPFVDGGMRCRIGLELWRQHRYGGQDGSTACAAAPAVVHLIGRSSPFSGNDDTSALDAQDATLVYNPRSGVSFWDLGDYGQQFEEARQRALPILQALQAGEAAAAPNAALAAPPPLASQRG